MALNQDNKKVEIIEALSLRVGRFLREKKFGLSDWIGEEIRSLCACDAIGLLYSKNQSVQESYFFGLIKSKKQPRIYLGYLNFKQEPWVFTAFGRENLKVSEEVCNDLSTKFNVDIKINLVQEHSRYERIYDPNDYFI